MSTVSKFFHQQMWYIISGYNQSLIQIPTKSLAPITNKTFEYLKLKKKKVNKKFHVWRFSCYGNFSKINFFFRDDPTIQ